MKMLSRKKSILAILSILPMTMLGGCSEYLSRQDRIAFGAGDAMAANKVVHVNDPWPRDGFDTRPSTMGQRLVPPVQRYRNGTPQRPGGAGAAGSMVASAAPGASAGN